MKKKLLIVSLSIGTLLWGNSPEIHHLDRQRDSMHHTISQTQKHQAHRKLDNQLKHKKAMRRTFKNAKEFKRLRNRNHHRVDQIRGITHRQSIRRGNVYDSHRYRKDFGRYNRYAQYDEYGARGVRHWKNRWYMIYKYERAGFFDNEGFFYGYFNHRGYMFEGEFYRYDRYYTYRDRVRGRGLFTRRYFRPILDVYSYNDYDDNCRGW